MLNARWCAHLCVGVPLCVLCLCVWESLCVFWICLWGYEWMRVDLHMRVNTGVLFLLMFSLRLPRLPAPPSPPRTCSCVQQCRWKGETNRHFPGKVEVQRDIGALKQSLQSSLGQCWSAKWCQCSFARCHEPKGCDANTGGAEAQGGRHLF